jgi:hypothetical protein
VKVPKSILGSLWESQKPFLDRCEGPITMFRLLWLSQNQFFDRCESPKISFWIAVKVQNSTFTRSLWRYQNPCLDRWEGPKETSKKKDESEVGGVSPTGKSFRFVRVCDAKLCVCLRDDVAPHRLVHFATKSWDRPCPCLPAGGSQLVSEVIDVASPPNLPISL